MANNQKKLKAFVRYDGSGRVVASSLILRKNKPRVGRWYEIPEYLCCNGTGSTTTTTTNGGGVTPTAWFGQITNSGPSDTWKWNACNGFGTSIIVYTSTTTITGGTFLYSDASLTTPIPYSNAAIVIQGTVYDVINGAINPLGGNGQPCGNITTTTSTTAAPASFAVTVNDSSIATSVDACDSGFFAPVTRYASISESGNPLGITRFYYDAQLTMPYQGNVDQYYLYMVGYPSGQAATAQMGSGGTLSNQQYCPTINFTVASDCNGQEGYNPMMLVNNFTGTNSGGNVYACINPQLDRQSALNNIYTGRIFNNSDPVTSGTPGGWTVGQTYWTAVRDVNDPSNVKAKSFVVTAC